MEERNRIIGSVGMLFSALSHLIRGDLSVISNDLSFISTLVPAGEVERAKSRCNSITSTLDSLQFIRSTQLNLETYPLPLLFEETSPGLVVVGGNNCCCTVDPALTRGVVSHIISVFFENTEAALVARILTLPPVESGSFEVLISRDGCSPVESDKGVGMLEAASALLGEPSVPQLALCELVLAVQQISCTVSIGSLSRLCSGLVFLFKSPAA